MVSTAIDQDYDCIVIGSGLSGLTVASLLAQLQGKRLLVLEQHFKAGGFTHSFRRQQFHWDVGLHYVGGMGADSELRHLFDLVTQGRVQWQKMPENFEKFVYPGLSFEVPSDRQAYIERLISLFPQEAKAIRRYFRDLQRAAAALTFYTFGRLGRVFHVLAKIASRFYGYGLDLTTQTYLDQHFHDAHLKALLVSQWGDYGLPPSLSPFAVHATIALHYLDGAYYPVGGPGTIAPAAEAAIASKGGKILLQREVTEILLDRGRAVGVRVRHREQYSEYFAPMIVSSVGIANTYLHLVPSSYSIPWRSQLREFINQYPPITNVTLFIGFKEDPRSLGFHGENHWLFSSFDHNAIYQKRGEWVHTKQPMQAYLSFPSLKDPQAKAHTIELIAFTDYHSFERWRDRPWLQRGEDYIKLKEELTQALLEMVERQYPGFRDAIAYTELATPLTNANFTKHHKGGIYGLSAVATKFQNPQWANAKTPIPGLYLTGVDLMMGGIVPAMMSGIFTLHTMGLPIPQVFAAAARHQKQLSGKSDHPSQSQGG